MNPRWIGILLIVAGIVILFFSLSGNSSTVNPGEEVILRIGQSVVIKGEDLKITFSEVTSDSRCPTGVTCVWAGEVSCNIEIYHSGKISFLKFVYPGSADSYSQLTYEGYTYSYKVEPYPEVDKVIPSAKYRLFLIVD